MTVLAGVIVLVAVLSAPAGAQQVYQEDGDPVYPVFEINAKTEAHAAVTWADHAAESIDKLAKTPLGKAVQVAVGLYNVLVNREMPLTSASINF
jgi:hypothetical protein